MTTGTVKVALRTTREPCSKSCPWQQLEEAVGLALSPTVPEPPATKRSIKFKPIHVSPECVNCGDGFDGGYQTEEVGPFCAQCWEFLKEHFESRSPDGDGRAQQTAQAKVPPVQAIGRLEPGSEPADSLPSAASSSVSVSGEPMILHLFNFPVGACGNDEGPYTFDLHKVTCAACRMAGMDLPSSIEDAKQRVLNIVHSEAGHIAYLADDLDALITVVRREMLAAHLAARSAPPESGK